MTTNTNTQTPCALGVSDRTLSDYRSDGLSAKEMERLRAHVRKCAACQARLAAYEALAQRLRAQHEPGSHARLWQNVRASIAASAIPSATGQKRHFRSAGRSHSTQIWAAFGSIAAVLALSVGFVALFVSHNGWPMFGTHGQGTATPIVIHSGSLTWKQVIVPRGFPGVDQSPDGSATNSALLGVQSNGAVAYACQADKRKVSAPIVWATRDAGASWSVITPPNIPANAGGCRAVLDANDANILIVSFYPLKSPSQPQPPAQWVTYATFDGGATWTKPAGLNDGSVIYQLASARGDIYGMRTDFTPDGKSQSVVLVSSDQMQSWKPVDSSLPEKASYREDVQDTGKTLQVWVNPDTGEVLDYTYAGSLWSTRDNGAHWTKIAYPEGVYTRDSHTPILFVGVGAPASSGYLTICGVFAADVADSVELLECSADDGKTWVKRPYPPLGGTSGVHFIVAGIGADGSIYATGTAPVDAGKKNASMYRLPPQATSVADWQRLGEIPYSEHGTGYQVAPAGDHTVFWLTPSILTLTDSSESTTTVQPNYYVATYP